MAEPIASSVISSLPRRRGPLLRVVKTAASRPSFSANFFTPAPRHTPTHLDTQPPLESVLDYRAWAYPVSKPSLWREDGLMRSLLLSELLPQQTSGHRVRRPSQPTRLRSRKAVSIHSSADRLNFSTAPPVNAQLMPRPHIPLALQSKSKPDARSPLDQFWDLIQHRAKSQHDLQLTFNAYNDAKEQDAFLYMAPEDVLKLAGDFATFIDYLCVDQVNVEVIEEWGKRLKALLEQLPSSSSSTVLGDLPRMSLLSRAASFSGHFHEAQKFFETLPVTTERRHLTRTPDAYQSAYESLILSMQRYEGMYVALSYMFTKNRWFSYAFSYSTLLRDMLVMQPFSIKDVLSLATKWNQAAYKRMVREIIVAFREGKAFDKALEVIDEQYESGLTIPAELLLHTSQGLANIGDLEGAQRAFDLVEEEDEDTQLYRWLKIFLLSRSKKNEDLEEVLAERQGSMLHDKEISSVLYPLAVEGRVPEIHKAFERFFPKNQHGKRSRVPNIYHYTQVVQAHARRAVIYGLDELLADMQEHGIDPNVQIMTNIISIYRKKVDTFGVLNTFEYMRKMKMPLDTILCTVVIGHLAKVRDSTNATKVYMEAIEDGVVPDEKMINALMNAYVENGSLKEAVAIFHHLTSLDADRIPSIDTFNTILKGYVLIGAPFHLISKLFLRLQAINAKPDGHTYATLVLSATDAAELEIAHGIYNEMKELQDSGQRSNLVTSHVPTILMSAYLVNRDLEKAKELLDEMTERGCRPTAVTYRAIVNSYGEARRIDWSASMKIAEDFVNEIKGEDKLEPNITRRPPLIHYYGPLIINHCKKGNITEVERLYNEYLDAGGEPTNLLLQHLLHCYGMVADARSAMDVWEIMLELAESRVVDGGIDDGEDKKEGEQMKTKFGDLHYPLSMYTDIVSKEGLHEQVASTWADLQSRGFPFDAHNWNHLAVALVRAGKVDRAFDIVESVLARRGEEAEVATEALKSVDAPDVEDKLKIPKHIATPDAEYPLHDLRRRLAAANSQKLTQFWITDLLENDEAIARDYSYPLQILQIIPPQWNTWRPHGILLRTLLVVILQLQRGYPIRPIQPGEIVYDNVSSADMTEPDREATQATLKSLYESFPWTTERVREFQTHEAMRLTSSQFEKIYMLR